MDFSGNGFSMRMLNVLAVPAFNDNYLWLIHDGIHAVAVDPGDAQAILAVLDTNNLSLVAILLTHHHPDHVGGVPILAKRFNAPVYGPRNEIIANVNHLLAENDIVTIPEFDLSFSVLDVPGHTSGHIAYYSAKQNWLFCGDTLFAGGCGRLFEGTAAQMANSLAKLAALPDATLVYCAHEYTLANLRFAKEVEPNNPALIARIIAESEKREHLQPTIPSTIGLEKQTNPFLRCNEPAIVQRMHAASGLTSTDPVSVFTALRLWKNGYR
jgi:hydroxyacylglutathione hydrolase